MGERTTLPFIFGATATTASATAATAATGAGAMGAGAWAYMGCIIGCLLWRLIRTDSSPSWISSSSLPDSSSSSISFLTLRISIFFIHSQGEVRGVLVVPGRPPGPADNRWRQGRRSLQRQRRKSRSDGGKLHVCTRLIGVLR